MKKYCKNSKNWYPTGSVIGSLLFSNFVNNLFLIKRRSEIATLADDNSIYSCGYDLNEVVSNVEINHSTLRSQKYGNGNGI